MPPENLEVSVLDMANKANAQSTEVVKLLSTEEVNLEEVRQAVGLLLGYTVGIMTSVSATLGFVAGLRQASSARNETTTEPTVQ